MCRSFLALLDSTKSVKKSLPYFQMYLMAAGLKALGILRWNRGSDFRPPGYPGRPVEAVDEHLHANYYIYHSISLFVPNYHKYLLKIDLSAVSSLSKKVTKSDVEKMMMEGG